MGMGRALRYMLIPVFSTTVFAYCVFAILSFMGNDETEEYNFFMALACAIVGAVANCRFAASERTIVSIAVLNGIMIALTEFFVFSAPNDVAGFWLHAIGGLCVAAPVIHGLMLSRNPIKISTMLLYCEFSIAGTVLMFGLQVGRMNVSPITNALCVIALILNLFMLSVLRVSGPAKKPSSGQKGFERGALLTMGLVGMVFAAVAIALFLLPASRNAIFIAAGAVRDFFVFIAGAIGRFIEFLVSLMPVPEYGPVEMEEAEMGAEHGDAVDMGELMGDIGIKIFVICAVAAAVAFVLVLARYRKKKAPARVTDVMVYEEEAGEGWPWLSFLRSLPARFAAWLRYMRSCLARRDSYEGAYLRIERMAKRRGLRRAAHETPRAFLYRVAAALPAVDKGGVDPLLDAISSAIDCRLYSKMNPDYTVVGKNDSASLNKLLAAAKTLPRDRRHAS